MVPEPMAEDGMMGSDTKINTTIVTQVSGRTECDTSSMDRCVSSKSGSARTRTSIRVPGLPWLADDRWLSRNEQND